MITVSAAGALALLLAVTLLGFAGGAASTAKAHYRDQQWLIRDQRIQAAALRMLYAATGFTFPTPDEEPQPRPSWPIRAKAFIAARLRGPAPVEPEAVEYEPTPEYEAAFDEEEQKPCIDHECVGVQVCPRCGGDAECAYDTCGCDDPDPIMQPTVKSTPGPKTAPAEQVIADDWEQQRDAMVADMLAEIRGKS